MARRVGFAGAPRMIRRFQARARRFGATGRRRAAALALAGLAGFSGLAGVTGLAAMTRPAAAEESVVLGLSRDKVSITTRFDGSEILIFGAVKRETPIPAEPLDVIVTVAGPSESVVVRRKARRLGEQ